MISFQKEPYPEEEIRGRLNPLVDRWFFKKFQKFSVAQSYAIPSILDRKNTLVSAPTGSGKTLTAFLSILSELASLSEKDALEDRVYCLYVSPLKALNNDIERNLNEPLREMGELAGRDPGIRVTVRTGDTSQSQKTAMLKKPPHILITTPETLGILLTAPKFRLLLSSIKWVIVDEIHSLAGGKRGVHLSLSLERLQHLAGRFTRVALSATVAPLEDVAKFLVGYENDRPRECRIVDVQYLKKLDLKVLTPVPNLMEATQQELSDGLYGMIHDLVAKSRTTLIFTNTRSATERVVHNLKERYPESYAEAIGAHHSSLSKEHRLDIEERLKSGELKCVVSSTSLELGIDIGYIDLVILLGSPKSVARALQRVGRSGHKLHETARGRIIVLDRDDLVECCVLLKDAVEGKIDRIHIPSNCLDVLAQHLYGIAIEDRQHVDNVYYQVRRSYPFRDLSRQDYDSVIAYLAGDYVDLEQRNVYSKIWVSDDGKLMGKRGKMARVLYATNIGTIPDESYVTVKIGNQKVGKIDELFLERLKKGDVFILGGSAYRFKYARGQTIQVTPASATPTVPSWFSEQLPLSFDLALEVGRFRRLVSERLAKNESREETLEFINRFLYVDDNSANSLYEYVRQQQRYAKVATDERILVESYLGFGNRRYLVFHTMYGRRVNDALSRVVAYLVSKREGRDVLISLSDNGFYLTAGEKGLSAERAIEDLKTVHLREKLVKAIDKTEVLERRFRHCATRSLMILRTYKGQRKSVGKQQIGSKLLLSFVKKLPFEFPILKEARREVLEDLMDIENAERVVELVRTGRIKVDFFESRKIPSPFALNLIARGYMDVMKTEERMEFIRRMHQAILAQINDK